MINGSDRHSNIEQSGTSADRLALDTSKVLQGTEFYELDTTARYKFYNGQWTVIVASGGASSYAVGSVSAGSTGSSITGMDRGTYIEQSGTSAERLALNPLNVLQASEFYETDTTARYKFYSGVWVMIVATGGSSSYV